MKYNQKKALTEKLDYDYLKSAITLLLFYIKILLLLWSKQRDYSMLYEMIWSTDNFNTTNDFETLKGQVSNHVKSRIVRKYESIVIQIAIVIYK